MPALLVMAGAASIVATSVKRSSELVLLSIGYLSLFSGIAIVAARAASAAKESAEQQLALTAIRPLMGKLPVPIKPRGWWIDPVFGQLLVETVAELRPRVVVECGSGSSTVLIAACLEELKQGFLLSLEEESLAAMRTREMLKLRGLDRWARVLDAPLTPVDVDGVERNWYSLPTDDLWLPDPIDLLVVDGPSAARDAYARFPAVPLLRPHFNSEAVILMDDGNRRGERETARAWGDQIGTTPQFSRSGKGMWILKFARD